MTAAVHTPEQDRTVPVATPESSTSSCVRRTSRSKVPRVVPPLLQGRDGSQWAPPGPAAARGDRPAVRKLSFIVGCEPCGRKRKAAASPSSTEDESDSRGTEVSSASVFRASSSRVDRASVVLVTRNLRLRCDSLVSGSDLASVPSRSLTDDGRQPSGATPCSNLRCDAAFALPEGARPRAGNADVPQTPPAAAQLSFQDWTAALQRSSGISNPLARPPLPLTPPGATTPPSAFLCEPPSPAALPFASKLSALETMLQCVAAAEHRARTAAAGRSV